MTTDVKLAVIGLDCADPAYNRPDTTPTWKKGAGGSL